MLQCFIFLKIPSTAFRCPCFSYRNRSPYRRSAVWRCCAPSTRTTASSTSCFSMTYCRNRSVNTVVVVKNSRIW
ncbi:ferredoxin-thioredoxin reductase catalytic domain-containing protein [Natrinema pallidum]|uniref:ferredoxin-thioredoxin reductase catalytic domain-containing protein n=1 Tax=Natrinema pallidum TaxID=69527 RepID=UPI00126884F0